MGAPSLLVALLAVIAVAAVSAAQVQVTMEVAFISGSGPTDKNSRGQFASDFKSSFSDAVTRAGCVVPNAPRVMQRIKYTPSNGEAASAVIVFTYPVDPNLEATLYNGVALTIAYPVYSFSQIESGPTAPTYAQVGGLRLACSLARPLPSHCLPYFDYSIL